MFVINLLIWCAIIEDMCTNGPLKKPTEIARLSGAFNKALTSLPIGNPLPTEVMRPTCIEQNRYRHIIKLMNFLTLFAMRVLMDK